MHWTVISLVWQTGWTAEDHVWCKKLATACSVTASVVNYLKYKYFKKVFELRTEYFEFCIWNILQQYFVFSEWTQKYSDRSISNTIFKSISYLIHYQKVFFFATVVVVLFNLVVVRPNSTIEQDNSK